MNFVKVVYLVDYDLSKNCGVTQKIIQQSSKWKNYDCEVYYASTKTLTLYDASIKEIKRLNPLKVRLGKVGTGICLFYNSFKLSQVINGLDFDLIYIRFTLYNPFIAKILKKHKVVMEINSDDTKEYKLKSKITYFYNILTRNFLLKNIDGYVCVSNELSELFKKYSKPLTVIANGIDTIKVNANTNITNNSKPKLVFITSSNQPWQGLDKVIKLSEHFTQYNFSIIGIDGSSTKNMRYNGFLSKKDAENIMQKCDVGIASLSLHEKGMIEASPLKSRHYLACGLPVIYAYEDTDLTTNQPFALKLRNSPDNLDFDMIKLFVEKVFHNMGTRQAARHFAINTLDFEGKEKKRIEFFRKVLSLNHE